MLGVVSQGYKVYYSLNPDLPLSRWFVLSVDNSQLTTISNLITNRTYAISVLAYTALGDGPMSWPPVLVKIQQGGSCLPELSPVWRDNSPRAGCLCRGVVCDPQNHKNCKFCL